MYRSHFRAEVGKWGLFPHGSKSKAYTFLSQIGIRLVVSSLKLPIFWTFWFLVERGFLVSAPSGYKPAFDALNISINQTLISLFSGLALAGHISFMVITGILMASGYDVMPLVFDRLPLDITDDPDYLRGMAWDHRDKDLDIIIRGSSVSAEVSISG